ncbi:MAG: LytTR family transcriptional regulator [Brevundimonas sp.]|nr:MAG: LytTR family transcriptional regulator [Brevundimonas sp.]
MALGERNRLIALALTVTGLIALLGPQLTAMLSPPPPRAEGPVWTLCAAPDRCQPVDVSRLPLDAPITTLRTTFAGDRAALTAPQAVHIAATASAEVWWNGERIGANGRVGPDKAREVPGRFSAVIPVPQDRIRPGENRIEIRMSAHHLWAPIKRPIHHLAVGPYRDPLHGTLRHYLPTLLLIGLLGFAFAGSAILWLLRRRPGSAGLTLLTGAVLAQAVVEASKLALTYSYPWQLARLATVAGLAALAALVVGLGARQFIADRRLRLWLVAGLILALAAALLEPPWWDAKALWSFRAGVTAALFSAGLGVLRNVRRARLAQAACVFALALSWSPDFLDSLYYLLFLILFGALAVRALYAPTSSLTAPASAQTLSLPNGASRLLVRISDLLHIRAADDYSIVILTDGRELLSTANLSALIALAPDHLLRIHRSHAINPGRIVAIHRSGKGHAVELTNGCRLPIGRTRRAAVEAWIA